MGLYKGLGFTLYMTRFSIFQGASSGSLKGALEEPGWKTRQTDHFKEPLKGTLKTRQGGLKRTLIQTLSTPFEVEYLKSRKSGILKSLNSEFLTEPL